MATKTLVLIVSCEATKDRREACLETWLSHKIPEDVTYKFVIGRPGHPSSLCGDILYVDCPDTYVDLSHKTWAMIREALTRFDFDWLFKCDDDTWVNLKRLQEYPKLQEYIGRKAALCGDDPDWHRSDHGPMFREKVGSMPKYEFLDAMASKSAYIAPWANGGSGYFLSRRACGLIAREPLSHAQRELYEDKFVGDVMASHGMYLHGAQATLRHKVDPHSGNHIMGATSLHPLLPKEMRSVYWRLLRAGEIET